MALGRLSIAAEPAHHWRWSLLRVRPERPDRHAAEHRDEFAPLQLIESRPAPNEPRPDCRISNWRRSVRRSWNDFAMATEHWRRDLASDSQSEWAARARRFLKFCEMQVLLSASSGC